MFQFDLLPTSINWAVDFIYMYRATFSLPVDGMWKVRGLSSRVALSLFQKEESISLNLELYGKH